MLEKLKEVFPEWESFSWWVYPAAAGVVLVLSFFIYSLFSNQSARASVEDAKEVEVIERLILLKAELATLQKQLEDKQVKEPSRVGRVAVSVQRPILGFTGSGEFQNIQKKK
jgi:uncharacterized protein YjaG (DUF416 family)